MSKQYRITGGHIVLNRRERDLYQLYPRRYWDVEIVETAGDKCEHRTWSTRERRNRRAGL